jgi:diguanylate cyclase (GGDEF)-like protein
MTIPPAAILLDISESGLAERCFAALHGLHPELWAGLADVPDNARVDLVISTRPQALAELGLIADRPLPDAGLLLIGCSDPAADAVLAADFADPELLLACRLLTATVHWRRQALHTAVARREFELLAFTDALTGLPNRRAWNLHVPVRLQAARAAGQDVCLTMLDVDRFKPVNDTHGHAAGDAVLAAVGQGLTEALRTSDTVARLGGDEFGLLLVGDFDGSSAAQIVERVRARIMQRLEAAVGRQVTISAGCVIMQNGAHQELDELAEAADAALREAKQSGRNCTRTAII